MGSYPSSLKVSVLSYPERTPEQKARDACQLAERRRIIAEREKYAEEQQKKREKEAENRRKKREKVDAVRRKQREKEVEEEQMKRHKEAREREQEWAREAAEKYQGYLQYREYCRRSKKYSQLSVIYNSLT